jgi:hypothetical protein
MKRDIELVKQILTYFETKTDWQGESEVKIEGYEAKVINYHIHIMYEGGLLNGEPSKTKEGRVYGVLPFRLTWKGHEFLDNTKGGRWEKIIKETKVRGLKLGFDTISILMRKIAERQIDNIDLNQLLN